jgi:hypothetical protein
MRSSTSVSNEFREAKLKGTITIVTNTWDDEAAVFLNVQKKITVCLLFANACAPSDLCTKDPTYEVHPY